jgi:hypothetical protein
MRHIRDFHLSSEDRRLFRSWMRGVATFYTVLIAFVLCLVALPRDSKDPTRLFAFTDSPRSWSPVHEADKSTSDSQRVNWPAGTSLREALGDEVGSVVHWRSAGAAPGPSH